MDAEGPYCDIEPTEDDGMVHHRSEGKAGIFDYAYMLGALVREPWGELDLGIVREEPPLAANNMTVFAEQWESVIGMCQNGTSDCRVFGAHQCGDGWLYADGGTLDLGLIRDSGCRCRSAATHRLHRMWSWLRWGGWRR